MRLSFILLLVSTFISQASTWTFHGCKDNYTDFIFWQSSAQADQFWARWDWNWDQAFPNAFDSGISVNGYINPSGYSETLAFDPPGGVFLYGLNISSPYSDSPGAYFDGSQTLGCVFDFSTMTPQPFDLAEGEYWLDYDGSGNLRLSTAQPSDFGKWAWDGSINPSWVEPLTAKKHHGKGHGK